MELKQGIRLISSADHQQAVTINSGICYASQESIPEVNFRKQKFIPQFQSGAILPQPDWRALTAEEWKCLNPRRKPGYSNTIFTGNLPGELVQKFKRLPLPEAATIDDIYRIFRTNEAVARELNEALNAFLSSIANERPFTFRCFGVGFPNLLSVSAKFSHLPKNHMPDEVQYIGLHNDCTSRMSIHNAYRFNNRISINIGQEPREFLFANLSLIQAYNMIRAKSPQTIAGVNLLNLPSIFFKWYPDYPILKVKLQPYQYYIAPTDNCFHDGRTLGNTAFDMTMIFFGEFS